MTPARIGHEWQIRNARQSSTMNDYLKNPSKQKNTDIKDTHHSELIQTRSRLCVSSL